MDTPDDPRATETGMTACNIKVYLEDGRVLSVPLAWFPTIHDADICKQQNVRIIGKGRYLWWPDLDEHLSVYGLLVPHYVNKSREDK